MFESEKPKAANTKHSLFPPSQRRQAAPHHREVQSRELEAGAELVELLLDSAREVKTSGMPSLAGPSSAPPMQCTYLIIPRLIRLAVLAWVSNRSRFSLSLFSLPRAPPTTKLPSSSSSMSFQA